MDKCHGVPELRSHYGGDLYPPLASAVGTEAGHLACLSSVHHFEILYSHFCVSAFCKPLIVLSSGPLIIYQDL